MSRARRLKRLSVADQKHQRHLRRSQQECRQFHWRKILASMKIDGWRQPCDQWVKVAYVTARCPLHRQRAVNVACSAVISRKEEVVAEDPAELMRSRIEHAERVVASMIVPRKHRADAMRSAS